MIIKVFFPIGKGHPFVNSGGSILSISICQIPLSCQFKQSECNATVSYVEDES